MRPAFLTSVAAGCAAFTCFLAAAVVGQPTSAGPLEPPTNGPRQFLPDYHALVHATVHVSPDKTLEDAALLIRDGRIVNAVSMIGKDWAPPAGARVWDCTDLHIYPGFIDAFVEVDAPKPPDNTPGAHWNSRVTPQVSALDGDRIADSQAEGLRKLGFAAAAIAPRDGLFRGTGAVVSLAKASDLSSAAKPPVYADHTFHAMSFESGGGGRRRGGGEAAPSQAEDRWSGYPGSEMGAIALIRQTFMDADWASKYDKSATAQTPSALGALDTTLKRNIRRGDTGQAGSNTADQIPLWFSVSDELDSIRAAKIAREFNRPVVLVGSGTEYQRLDAIKADGLGQVIPLNYPKRPDVSSIGKAEAVELGEMMAWEQAPTNPRRLDAAGLKVALTTSKLPRGQNFPENLKEAMKAGLKPDRALAMLTVHPAELLAVSDRLGTIEQGKIANLVVADGDLFVDPNAEKTPPKAGEKKDEKKKDAKIRDIWIDGQRHEINAPPALKLEGEWELSIPGAAPVARSIVFDADNKVTVKRDGKTVKASSSSLADNRISFVFDHEPLDGVKGLFTSSGIIEGTPPSLITGTGFRSTGERFTWSATRKAEVVNPLAGDWVVVEADGKAVSPTAQGTPKIAIAKDNSITVKVGDKSATGSDVLASGQSISYVYDNKALGGDGDGAGNISDMLTLKDDVIEGVSKFPNGSSHAFKMKREGEASTKSIFDSWVIVQIDQQTISAKSPDTTLITIKEAKPADKAAPAGGGRERGGRRDRDRGGEAGQPVPQPAPDANKQPDAPPAASPAPAPSQPLTPEPPTVTINTLAERTRDYSPENIKLTGDQIEYSVNMAKFGELTGEPGQGFVNVTATRSGDELNGSMTIPDGTKHTFKAIRKPEVDRRYFDIPEQLGYPFGPYMTRSIPDQPDVLVIHNATIWTCNDKNDIIENGTIIVRKGKIDYVGEAMNAPHPAGAVIVDAGGKHVTPGIIDCHSHTGISRGVNEGGQAVTSEVRIQDVTNPDSISWYRQLGAGVTAVNSLHGSANPIGGQNCVNKNRWGVPHPDDMHFDGRDSYSDENPLSTSPKRSMTMPGIKFALGENVKQSNWGEGPTGRYPRSRMGVETIIRDRFTAAREYAKAWKDYASNASGNGHAAPRRDLELEALAEILDGKRLIHCHSYRQDEIFALAKLAQEFGFKLGTYQHNLEGYKVAEAVKASARGASLFSDWWNYKVEVQDAIPQAGPIMHEVGVVVSFNSDSDELARRLNSEAGKAVRFGVENPSEALKFVTLNPAKQLAIDNRVGSLEAGKDADIAIWSGVPLSSTSRCEATYIDGRCYFSLALDQSYCDTINSERQRLIQKILTLAVGKGQGEDKGPGMGAGRGPGGPAGGPGRRGRPTDDDQTIDATFDEATSGRASLPLMERMRWDARREHYLEMIRRGQDPRFAKCGDCGELFGQQ